LEQGVGEDLVEAVDEREVITHHAYCAVVAREGVSEKVAMQGMSSDQILDLPRRLHRTRPLGDREAWSEADVPEFGAGSPAHILRTAGQVDHPDVQRVQRACYRRWRADDPEVEAGLHIADAVVLDANAGSHPNPHALRQMAR
jgi:hypothetical protein